MSRHLILTMIAVLAFSACYTPAAIADDSSAQKAVLVTGASSGIGAATARMMAAEGACLSVVGIPEGGVMAVARELEATGGKAGVKARKALFQSRVDAKKFRPSRVIATTPQ